MRRKFASAEEAYEAVVTMGSTSSYYELALYKLGWTLYKQEFYEEALHEYIALLDYKVSTGYDFDAKHEEEEAKRIADTLQVISLSLSNLGGPEVIDEYFATNGHRGYEDRIYSNLAEFYLRSAATRTRPPSTARSSRSTRCTPSRRASACAWSRSTTRAASRSSCSSRRRSSRRATDCRPSTGSTST